MAYRIGATTVISSSRELQNIATLDATTTTTISDAVSASGSGSTFTRGATAISTNSFTVAAGMYMIQLFSIATNNGGYLTLPTTNTEFGMINMIKTSTNTANAIGDCYYYDGTDWYRNNLTTATTQLPIINATSGGQNVSSGWGFLTFTGAATFSSYSFFRCNLIKVS